MKTTITDPRITSLSYEQAEVSLALLIEEENSWFDKWDNMLGLTWDRDVFLKQATTPETPDAVPAIPEKVFYPLSLLIKPEILLALRKVFGLDTTADSANPEVTQEGGKIPMTIFNKDAFIRKMSMGRQVGADTLSVSNPMASPTVGLKQGPVRRLGDR